MKCWGSLAHALVPHLLPPLAQSLEERGGGDTSGVVAGAGPVSAGPQGGGSAEIPPSQLSSLARSV